MDLSELCYLLCKWDCFYIEVISGCLSFAMKIYEDHIRRKFRSQTSDNMERWKAEQGRGREKRKIRRKKSRRERVRRQKMQMREKGRKVAKHCVFPMICGSEGSKKSRLAKAAGAEPAGQMRDENLHAVVARSTFWSQNVQNTPGPDHFWQLRCRKSARRCGAKHIFQVKMYKTHHCRTTFGSSDVEKVHAVVARSTFRSQNVQNTPCADHFWRFRCRKSARRCGVKHISKSKCAKHHMFAPLLEVQMSLRFKTLHYRTLHYTTLQYTTLHYTPLHYAPLHYTTLHNTTTTTTQLHSTTLHYTKLHYTTLYYTPLHYTTLHCTTFHYTSLHYTTLHYTTTTTTTTQLHSTTIHSTTLQYTKLHYTTLHYTTLHYTTLHCTTLPPTTLHYITLHYTPLRYNYNYDYTTTLHYTKLHYTTLHYTTFHYTPLHYTTLHYTTIHWMTLHHR